MSGCCNKESAFFMEVGACQGKDERVYWQNRFVFSHTPKRWRHGNDCGETKKNILLCPSLDTTFLSTTLRILSRFLNLDYLFTYVKCIGYSVLLWLTGVKNQLSIYLSVLLLTVDSLQSRWCLGAHTRTLYIQSLLLLFCIHFIIPFPFR